MTYPIPFLRKRPVPKIGETMKTVALDSEGEVWHISEMAVISVFQDYRRSGQWRAVLGPSEPRSQLENISSNANEWIPVRTEIVPSSWVLYTRDGDKKPLYWAPPDTVWDADKGEFVKPVKPITK